MKYIVQDIIPMYVKFNYEVEADSLSEARKIYEEDSGKYLGLSVGNEVENANSEIRIIEIDHTGITR